MRTTSVFVSLTVRSVACAALALLLFACMRETTAGARSGDADKKADEAILRKNTQALLDAIATGDTATWNRLLDPNVIIVDENDIVRDKTNMLAQLKPLAKGLEGSIKTDDWKAAFYGDIAVVTHEDNENLDYHGQNIRSRFRNTETWIKSGNDWRETSSMVLAVLKDPPPITLAHSAVCAFNGRYDMAADISATLQCSGDSLVMKREGKADRIFLPETRDVFFEPGAPRTRRIFQYDAHGNVTGFVDRREARDIAWTRAGAVGK